MSRFALVLVLLVLATSALGQSTVTSNQGKPGTQGAWPVSITAAADGGSLGPVSQGPGQDGGVWGVSALAEGTVGSATPTRANAVGVTDGTNLRVPMAYDVDTSGSTSWGAGSVVIGPNFGGANIANVEGTAPTTSGATGLYVWAIPKDVTNPVSTAVSCSGTSATAAPSSVLSNRTTLTMFNNSNDTIYIGGSAVTTANGLPLLPSASFSDNVANATYYCISSTTDGGTSNLRVLEN